MITGELSSKDLQNSDIEVYHVKLTDSCLKALEKAASKALDDSCKLELAMNEGNTGSLTIAQDEDKRTFGFAISDIMIDPKGSFDCVKRSRTTNFCQSVASIKRKLTIQATDDTYSATREKIQLAELDAKKNQTKQLKPGISRRGRRPSRSESVRRAAAISNSGNTDSRRPLPPILRQSAALDKAEALASKAAPRVAQPKSEETTGKLAEHSLRERVVHLLALKSYTQPEILLRLQKDGLVDADKNRLQATLTAVGHPNRQGKFLLLPKLFHEVQVSWPAYNAEDRELIAKRRASTLRLTPLAGKSSSKDGFHQSSARRQTRPMPLAGGGNSAQTAQKLRAVAEVGERRKDEEVLRQVALKYCVSRDTLAGWCCNEEMLRRRRAKELGVSLDQLSATAATAKQPDATTAAAKQPDATTAAAKQPDATTATAAKRPAAAAAAAAAPSPPKRACPPKSAPLPSPVSDVSPNSCCRASPAPTPPPPPSEGSNRTENNAEPEFEPLPEEHFLPDYPEISSRDQMIAYKSDFHREYKEYSELYVFVSESIEKLQKLESELDLYPESSPQYERVGAKIVAAVDSLNRYGKNPREVRRRLDFLDAKLGHIKKQIAEYRHRTGGAGSGRR